MRVLVVDDERNLLMTLAANLELEGFDVVTAENGQRALDLFEEEPFDLVLSDIRMPVMNGVDLFRRLRAKKPELPVVLMTAFALEGLVNEALREGAFTILPKPFDINHVVAALTTALRAPVVLLVAEESDHAAEIAKSLCDCGVRARRETSAEAAIGVVNAGDVDVCVLDVGVAGDVRSLMDRIREAAPSISLIAVAAKDVGHMMRQAAASGVFACMHKPVNAGELIEVIARARGRRPGSS